jgi:hypothetical protein
MSDENERLGRGHFLALSPQAQRPEPGERIHPENEIILREESQHVKGTCHWPQPSSRRIAPRLISSTADGQERLSQGSLQLALASSQ